MGAVLGVLATGLLACSASNRSCVDLLSLPVADESTRCYGADCSCQILVEEVVWLVLQPAPDGAAGLEHRSRSLTPTLGQWIDEGFAFLEGRIALSASFRTLWPKLVAVEDCPVAAELATLMWSLVRAISACSLGSELEAWEPEAPETPRVAAAKSMLRGSLCQDLYTLARGLVSERGMWSRPFWLPLPGSRPLRDAADFALAQGGGDVSEEVMRTAFLDFLGITEAVFEQVWLDQNASDEVLRNGRLDGARKGCRAVFYTTGDSGGIQLVAEYLIAHEWSCFLAGDVKTLESRSIPRLDCVLRQGLSALRLCARHLEHGERGLPCKAWGVALQCSNTLPSAREGEEEETSVLSPAQRSLARWLDRRQEAARGNSLCFSEARKRAGFTFERCCQDGAGCFDDVLTQVSCCRDHPNGCADLRLHVAAWSAPQIHKELLVEVNDELRCMGDDVYRDYFEDVRQHMQGNTLQAGILGTRVEKFVASLAEKLLGSCPEVSFLGRIVITHRICQSILQNPLSPDAFERQEMLRQDVEVLLPNLEANLEVGYLTQLSLTIITELLEGACGKMIQADREGEEEAMHGVLEPSYRWPRPTLGRKQLKEQGLNCSEGPVVQVGNGDMAEEDAIGWDNVPLFFVDLDHPMPFDGRLSKLEFPYVSNEDQDVHLDVLQLRPVGSGYARKATIVFEGTPVREELYVWRGDLLAFAGTGARMVYRNCSSCRAGVLSAVHSSYFSEVRKQNFVDVGETLQRAYSWSAELVPMKCQRSRWDEGPLPLVDSKSPRSSHAHCAGATWEERSCRFRNLCYHVDTRQFEFYGQSTSQELTVGLSMFTDVRSSWAPSAKAPRDVDAAWIEVPTYLAMRHAAHNWGHHAVETTLALYALIMSNEDLTEVHGRRLIFFLDDCSLELQGDSIEFCMQFVADPVGCIQDIPRLCAKFTRELWPLLSDWAPLEVASLPHRAPGVHLLCFRSLSAGLSPWRRPVQTQDAEGRPLAQQEWAADPRFAPVIRQFKVAAVARLQIERSSESTEPLLLAAVKNGRRSVRNRLELLTWLQQAAERPSLRLGFRQLDFNMSLKDQVRFISSSRLFVASMGATLMAGLMLPSDAAILALPACHKVGPGRSVTCESEELLKACGLRWAQYPVTFDDVVYTIGRGFDFTARKDVINELIEELMS